VTANQFKDGDGVKLRLQRLPQGMKSLAVGALASVTSGSSNFTTKDVVAIMHALKLPPLGNPSDALGKLRVRDLLMRPSSSTWALTPEGEATLAREVAHISVQALALELGQVPGAQLGNTQMTVIPPFLGPMARNPGLKDLLSRSAFDRNVMLITRFPKTEDDPFGDLIRKLRIAVAEHGLELQVASDSATEDTLWANVVTYMWASKYAIVLMDRAGDQFNSNVLIEVGGMLMTGRKCAILKDASIENMPSDIAGHIYRPADLSDHKASVEEIHTWLRDDLHSAACGACAPE
jgi:hypothetical protein